MREFGEVDSGQFEDGDLGLGSLGGHGYGGDEEVYR